MKTLIGENINLRPLEPEDLQFLFESENDESNWNVSNTQVPFSKYILKKYIENSYQDIYEAKQVRLVIEHTETHSPIGMIDLFDFEPTHKRAGVGILIKSTHQNKGYATEALQTLIGYAFNFLNLHQLYANITIENSTSIKLFEKFNFQRIGIKKDWILHNNTFKDEATYQLIYSIKGDHD